MGRRSANSRFGRLLWQFRRLDLKPDEQRGDGAEQRHYDCKTEEHPQRLTGFLGVEVVFFHRLHIASAASGRRDDNENKPRWLTKR
jgi:hypothetical protein